MKTKREIFLYIGMGKAGSTYIRSVLYDNMEILKNVGGGVLYYTKKTDSILGIPSGVMGLEEIIREIIIGKLDVLQFNEVFISEILPVFIESGCNKMILASDEMFLMNDNITFSKVFLDNGFDVKVIAYIRRPVEFLASVWGERLKPYIPEQMTISMEEEGDYYHIQFNTILEFIKLLGKENVIVRPFEKEQWKNGSFVEDWLSCIGINSVEGFEFNNEPENTSYSRNLSEILLLINRIGLPLERTQYYKKKLLEITKKDDTASIIDTLSDTYIDRITNQYRPILKQITDVYGNGGLFLNEYPSCYHTEREDYNQVCILNEQMDIIKLALSEGMNNTI